MTLSALEAHHLADLLQTVATVDHVPAPPVTTPEAGAGAAVGHSPAADGDGAATTVARLPVVAGGPYDGRRLGVVTASAAVVAVLRDGHRVVDATDGLLLRHGDTLVVVGQPEEVTRLGRVDAGDLDG
ncbi:TrkA C-terminal domain-containing protein [Pilimelia columellifera]|uniref:RCK C-terminal domain-containing protein n=1 Tax=Pilimelia columellifera subsp. columellifera TaxID=706583 RepID=A0ABN3NLD5_9ACTN